MGVVHEAYGMLIFEQSHDMPSTGGEALNTHPGVYLAFT